MPFNFNQDSGGDSSPASSSSGAGGGSFSGGGSVATVPAANSNPAPATSPTAGFTTGTYLVTRKTADRVELGPAVRVQPGDIVTVSPIPTNTANCFYSLDAPDTAKFGPRVILTSTANPRTVVVRSLNEIALYSAVVGEGIVIDHQQRG